MDKPDKEKNSKLWRHSDEKGLGLIRAKKTFIFSAAVRLSVVNNIWWFLVYNHASVLFFPAVAVHLQEYLFINKDK